jgi:flagellar biosynthetic protein FliQ
MLVVGLIISMIQAATSINEQTVSFVPKLLAFILFLALYGATAGDLLIDYTRDR